MIYEHERLVVELRVPWRLYQRKTREASLTVRVRARDRWRWWQAIAHTPQHYGGGVADRGGRIGSLTLEAKSWLTDLSLRGNLRCKAFVRVQVKGAVGGMPEVGNGCPVLGPRGQRCTWQRGHLPMVIRWKVQARQDATGGGTWPHSWAVPLLGGRNGDSAYEVVQEPRRPRSGRLPR